MLSICAHQSAVLCVDVVQGGREIGRSSLVAGKWGDLFFGSFPVKFPGDQDTENIYLYTSYVLHKKDGEPEREREGAHEVRCVIKEDRGREVKCHCAGAASVFRWHLTDFGQIEAQRNRVKTPARLLHFPLARLSHENSSSKSRGAGSQDLFGLSLRLATVSPVSKQIDPPLAKTQTG